MTEQTKAQRLANMLVDWDYRHHIDLVTAATELRRLDALNAELMEALEAMQNYAAAEGKGLRICDEALAKAKEQT